MKELGIINMNKEFREGTYKIIICGILMGSRVWEFS